MGHVASKRTHNNQINAASGDIDIESGEPITVYGVRISEEAGSLATVDFKTSIDRSGAGGDPAGTVFDSIVVNGNTYGDNIEWFADSGLTLDVTAGTVNVTIYHSHQGG